MDRERQEKLHLLAEEVLRLSRNTLLVNLRFMDAALSRLKPVVVEKTTFATDGRFLAYDPAHVLRCYKQEKTVPVRDYLHIVLHCVFRHMFVDPTILRPCWDLACDMAVEYSILSMGLNAASARREQQQRALLDKMKKEIGQLTAEKIYHYCLNKGLSLEQMADLRGAFYADDHSLWYMNDEEKLALGLPAAGGGDSNSESEAGAGETAIGSVEDWAKVAHRMQVDMETFSKQQGDRAGNLMQNLREVNRERYDYTAFLKKFAVRGEVMRVNDEEFDYVYYTYGLSLYKNLPLIEPLEYKEVKRIREFVIAIDTSGSVAGELVQAFLQKTYNILKSTESFFSRINVHIIQCDAAIQEDAKITSQEEFDAYLKKMKLRGFGGTDFRPVFSYVDELRTKRELANLKGLIYFTDGWGTFPAKKPEYDAAFVFVDDGQNNYEVPPWAIKLVLQKEEL